MNALIEKILVSELLDVPVVIWLGGIILFAFFLLALVVRRVCKIHIQWKSKKRFLLIETDNGVTCVTTEKH
jgi:hypothetical protein